MSRSALEANFDSPRPEAEPLDQTSLRRQIIRCQRRKRCGRFLVATPPRLPRQPQRPVADAAVEQRRLEAEPGQALARRAGPRRRRVGLAPPPPAPPLAGGTFGEALLRHLIHLV